jgi:hypothetical protein
MYKFRVVFEKHPEARAYYFDNIEALDKEIGDKLADGWRLQIVEMNIDVTSVFESGDKTIQVKIRKPRHDPMTVTQTEK